jgi:uncharacterized Ntn-hydrolase superfamily protein
MFRPFFFLFLVLTPGPSWATWSIVAVDPATGDVGSAGASCTPYVAGIARLVPGRGAIVAQAASNMEAKALGARLIAEGAAPTEIIASITDPAFDAAAAQQQYGIAVLRPVPRTAVHDGAAIRAERHSITASTFAVLGNTLVSRAVVERAAAEFSVAPNLPLADRLLAALEAGAKAGGDRRCGAKTAQSAYLGVAKPGDRPTNLSVRLIITTDPDDTSNPVALLRRRYDGTR